MEDLRPLESPRKLSSMKEYLKNLLVYREPSKSFQFVEDHLS